MIVLHATWTDHALRFWGEGRAEEVAAGRHPFAAGAAALVGAFPALSAGVEGKVTLRLPLGADGGPLASARAAHARGHEAGAPEGKGLGRFEAPCVAIVADEAGRVLESLEDSAAAEESGGVLGQSVEYWAAAARFVRSLLVQQRFVPLARQTAAGEIAGLWAPWLSDESTAERAALLLRAMPAVCRAAEDEFEGRGWLILDDFLTRVTDAACRRALVRETMAEALSERAGSTEIPVAWMSGLLGASDAIEAAPAARQEVIRRVRHWIGSLDERGPSVPWRLCLRLGEPTEPGTGDEASWPLTLHLQAVDQPSVIVDASDVWLLPGDSIRVDGRRLDSPRDLLLAQVARAARIYGRLNESLEESEPTGLTLTTRQAYQFLREFRPLLIEQGFGVLAPEWWDSPMARLGARLRIESDAAMPGGAGGVKSGGTVATHLGLGALVRYKWEIAVGSLVLTLREFEQLAARKSPLVQVDGRWVEIRPEDVEAAIRFINEHPGGEMNLGDALRIAYGSDARETGIPVVGLDAGGWVAAFLNSEAASRQLEVVEPPKGFHGTLRPYQLRGLSWLAFQERLGFGVCLADDMGLGKTIQLLALLAEERERAAADAALGRVKPTLLVVPMSVVGNWDHETRRFCPELRVLQHHGPERKQGEEFVRAATEGADLVVTTYGLAHRDHGLLSRVEWGRLVLDEAQYIKNPGTKQAGAVRSIPAERRVCLTGTPVENRLSELWSILDFLNPGYLGSAGGFRQRFAVPIERYHDRTRAEQLRGLIRPFVLRRLKTDPTVIADLPEKLESREYCHLTTEQATLYESCVRRMLGEIEMVEGIRRRGMVLAGLIKLKQICNHPAQLLRDEGEEGGGAEASRSGKCVRLVEMLEEVLAEGDQSLVFTQFRRMGHILWSMLRRRFDREVLFLHGGTAQKQREQIVATFQRAGRAAPILILSLKAGGVGVNLTAATHVFHFDRWWNPAVENQATDRAYRIGQTRTVQVHKFVVRGTLEERIDQMIEQKTELAENIIGSGEHWLTELSTEQLRDILALRNDAVGDEF